MKNRAVVRGCVCVFLALAAGPLPAGAEAKLDADGFGGLEARSLGPAAMGGRIMDIVAVPGDKLTVYVGAASGGVWKSKNGGITFDPVFDKYSQSIGALAVDPSKPDTVWVGTGEACTRNSVSVGTGVYRTSDGGETWQAMGLKDSERIARILVHPKEPATVFVCAAGHLWDSHEERGVFRTKDAGKTWEKVLYVDPDTGCAEMAMDPQDPRVLYAALWQFRRSPDFFRSGGPGSGLYKSADGGTTWKKVTKGLPEGELGRIGLAVAPSRPSVVYATVEAKKTALYRSDDLGESWTEMNASSNIQGRPFYFSHLAVDPRDFERVYKLGTFLTVSSDGGRTFGSPGGGSYHPDLHALWIHPDNPQFMLLGTDGGLYATTDRGGHWRQAPLPISQFYHVTYDMEWPYNVYGGLQDNGSWMGPSRTSGTIAGRHWKAVGGGDGFWAFPDPGDADIVYVEYQGGHIQRTRKSTGETKDIMPFPREGEPKYRFNWNSAVHLSRTSPGTMYVGAQFLFRSRDRGDSWERISPDLTTDDKTKQRQELSGGLTIDNSSAENHCTIFSISESPRNPALLWVGTDDGNLQVSRDGGKTWSNVSGNVPGLPRGTWVSRVEAGRFDEGTAYATFDGHRAGDMRSYVYKTADFGKTWTSLATPEIRGYAHVILEDPVKPELLYLGTEMGLQLSIDGGRSWVPFTNKIPPVPVYDLALQPREHDLIVASHGRGIYILDDITPLRQLTRQVLEADAAVLDARPSVRMIPAGEQRFDADDQWVAFSPPETATIVYYLKSRPMFGDLRVEVYDEKGTLLSTIPGSKRRGLNRVEWPMRLKAPKVPPAANLVPNFFAFVGPRHPAGTYAVKLIKGDKTYDGAIRLVEDPRATHSEADRAAQRETVLRLYGDLERLTYLVDSITDLRDRARAAGTTLGQKDRLRVQLAGLADRLDELRKSIVASREGGQITGEEKLRERLGMLYGAVNGYEGRPTESQTTHTAVLEKELDGARAQFDGIVARDLAAVNSSLAAKTLEPLRVLDRAEWEKRQAGGSSTP